MIKLENIDGSIGSAKRGLILNHVDCMDDAPIMVYDKWDIEGITPLSGEGMKGLAHMISLNNDLYVANCYITHNDVYINKGQLNHVAESCLAFAAVCKFDMHVPYDDWFKVGHIFLSLNKEYDVKINIYNGIEEI